MSRAFDFTVVAVIWIIAAVVHRIGLALFAPGQPLFELAANGNQVLNGASRAWLWSQILIMWVPLIAAGGILVWAVFREYRRGAATAVTRP
jgi:hypothetical protein